jgi:small-conductance mechanosensitive channel
MRSRQRLILLGLSVLLLASITALIVTRDASPAAPSKASRKTVRVTPVDEKPLQTARRLDSLAATADERRFAQEAERVSDHEVDLAFAQALRDAGSQMARLTPQSRDLFTRLSKAEAELAADQAHLEQLKKQVETASGDRQDRLQQEADLTQAQVELDQDEVGDAKEDIDRAGVDPTSAIQKQFTAHEAAEHQHEANQSAIATASEAEAQPDNLLSRIIALREVRRKSFALNLALGEAGQDAAALAQSQEKLEQLISGQTVSKQAITQQVRSQLTSSQGDAGDSAEATDAAITTLHQLSDAQKDLADLDKRIQDHQELRETYGSWNAAELLQQRALLHRVLESVLWLLVIVFAVYLAGVLVDRFLPNTDTEHNRVRTLRVVIRFATQVLGVLLGLFVIFGAPKQMPTILGLAGAGLTVALKDFIVAFVGWFVLMGRNGIRTGDWVEINGVVGEVIEVSLFRTVLLETGNWTDSGHPTGRKVAFVNSYAIEGHFFNFSTTGQWLWDELEIMIPSAQDPYPIIESIQKMVEKETAESARAAESEWKQATTKYRVQSVTATPAVNLKPTSSGVEVHIRYITQAHQRFETRARLNQALVSLLRNKGVSPPDAVAAASRSSPVTSG